ncbi:phage integrase family protein [Rhodococcus opacus]|nr:phage integrase family protein [Rhodococcus opacus]
MRTGCIPRSTTCRRSSTRRATVNSVPPPPRSSRWPERSLHSIQGSSFRLALKQAATAYLQGPVRVLTPHVLRHACASGLYRDGVGLMAIQQLLGHRWLTTTMRYVHVADDLIEAEYAQAAKRAAARFTPTASPKEG